MSASVGVGGEPATAPALDRFTFLTELRTGYMQDIQGPKDTQRDQSQEGARLWRV